MSKHTPGPWADVSDIGTVKARKLKNGHQLMALVSTGGGQTAIDCTGSGENFLQDCANARLIAAAPDMYELIDDIAGDDCDKSDKWLGVSPQENCDCRPCRARRIRAKAEGT